jgi:hypothetical protein
LVKDHFQDFGFTLKGDGWWHLSVEGYAQRKNYIKEQL